MAKIQYTEHQIYELQKNKYVKSVKEKYITFTHECKEEFIKQTKEGLFYRDIFRVFQFPEYIIHSELPRNCFQRWTKKDKTGNLEGKKGRPKKKGIDIENMSIEEQNEYLRTENAYLKELHKMKYGHYP